MQSIVFEDSKIFYYRGSNAVELSIYDAIELAMYHKVDLRNGVTLADPQAALKKYPPKEIDTYGWAVIVEPSVGIDKYSGEQIHALVRNYSKDYVLEHRFGHIDLYHVSNNWPALKQQGYVPSAETIEKGGGSFAIGLYCYNERPDNKFLHGKFYGHYFVCVYDGDNMGKDGTHPDYLTHEIFVPWNTQEIIWEDSEDLKPSTVF